MGWIGGGFRKVKDDRTMYQQAGSIGHGDAHRVALVEEQTYDITLPSRPLSSKSSSVTSPHLATSPPQTRPRHNIGNQASSSGLPSESATPCVGNRSSFGSIVRSLPPRKTPCSHIRADALCRNPHDRDPAVKPFAPVPTTIRKKFSRDEEGGRRRSVCRRARPSGPG